MHCPSCGHESSLDQKYCRTCGFALEPVSKLIAERPTTELTQFDKEEKEKALVRRMFRIMGWGLLIALIGVVFLVAHKSFPPDRLFNFLGSFFLLSGTVVAGYSLFDAMREKTKPALPHSRPQDRDQIPAAEVTKELLQERIPIPVSSVTERTTQLIARERSADSKD